MPGLLATLGDQLVGKRTTGREVTVQAAQPARQLARRDDAKAALAVISQDQPIAGLQIEALP